MKCKQHKWRKLSYINQSDTFVCNKCGYEVETFLETKTKEELVSEVKSKEKIIEYKEKQVEELKRKFRFEQKMNDRLLEYIKYGFQNNIWKTDDDNYWG